MLTKSIFIYNFFYDFLFCILLIYATSTKTDLSRFQIFRTDEEDERLKERTSNNINFLDDTEEPYWSLEDT